ncbi:hypothetical protein ACFL4T_05425 [candidate division KSB1 bacterium]
MNIRPINIAAYTNRPTSAKKPAVEFQIKIDPELKAMGTLSREFKVEITPDGIKVNIVA